MGGVDSKAMFREAIQDLANNEHLVAGQSEAYWDRFWAASGLTANDFFEMVTPDEMRNLRDNASGNLTTLCFKLVQRLSLAAATGCSGVNDYTIVLNCVRLLMRIIPFLFECADWRDLFWSPIAVSEGEGAAPSTLAQTLLSAVTDLLFCPDFTVAAKKAAIREQPVDLGLLDSCEYIWEAGVGCAVSTPSTWLMDSHRTELLQLLVTCCSESLYHTPQESLPANKWLDHLISVNNRHVLPLLVSLLNSVCAYNPGGYGIPYYHTLVYDYREHLVETSAHLLMILLDYSSPPSAATHQDGSLTTQAEAVASQQDLVFSADGQQQSNDSAENLFKLYISKLHQKEDLQFISKGISVLLSNHVKQSYFSMGAKRIGFVQEVLVLLWKIIELNKKFLGHLLQSAQLFDIIVPILYEMLNAKTTPSKVGMLHVGVFILLVLSGERNFGVRLNKPYNNKLRLDLPSFNGNHADLLFLVLHRIIISGLPRLQPLYDCLLTIISNVSPYVKSLSLLTCTRLIHLLESFSTPWFLCARPSNHFLIFFLLETFNNLVQYQFDGNTNMVYSMIRSKAVFYQLANLTEESCRIPKSPTQPSSSSAMLTASSRLHHNGHVDPPVRPGQQEQHPVEVHSSAEALMATAPEPDATPHDDNVETLDMPEMNTPDISLEVSEAAKDDVAVTDDQTRISVDDPTSPSQDDSVAFDVEAEIPIPKSEAEIPVPKPQPEEQSTVPTPPPEEVVSKPQSELEIPIAKPQPVDQSDVPVSIPEPHSVVSASRDEVSQLQGPKLYYPKPPPARTKPIPSPRSLHKQTKLETPGMIGGDFLKPFNKKGKLLPLREKLADNANKLLETSDQVGFVPTAEWLHHWKSKLPLEPIMKLLQILVPQVDKMCKENDVTSEQVILSYLKNGTLVGLLPVPHPIIVRRYRQNFSTDMWFHTYIWGVIFVRNTNPPIWIDTQLRLFQVQILD